MAYLLDGSTIKSPNSLKEEKMPLVAQQRTLSGAIGRDYFGSSKKMWVLKYTNTSKTDYDIINAIYTAYLASVTPVTWEITETNYTVASTNVHMDLNVREFGVGGSDYISDFELILTET